MKIFNNLFGTKSSGSIALSIGKYDVVDMKESRGLDEKQAHHDLNMTPNVVDRRTLMNYEKKFMDRFKKLGNLNQKCPYCAKAYQRLNLGEKKCTECSKSFMVQKRVQDMGTVAFRMENKAQFEYQWKATGDIKKFKNYLPHEYDYIQKQLQKQGKKHLHYSGVMHSVINAYAKNSLSAGYYQLYASLMFHKAELMRQEQRFAEALEYYFYVHYLHSNAVSNEASLGVNTQMNPELREAICAILDLGGLQVKKIKDLYDYSIEHLNRFNTSSTSVSTHKAYSNLMREFKEEDAQKEGIKPMRSFVLYTKAS